MAFIDIKLSTERLLLRPFQLSDLEASYEMNLDLEVSKYTGDGGVVSKMEIKRRIEEEVLGDYKKYRYGRFAVEIKGENKFIGFAGLKYLPEINAVDLGYRFLSAHWGKGFATEAGAACVKYRFEELGLGSIIALVIPDNRASIRVLEKLGFGLEKEVIEDGVLANQYMIRKKTWKEVERIGR